MTITPDFAQSRSRLIQLDANGHIAHLSAGARELGLTPHAQWTQGFGNTCQLQEIDFLLTADPTPDGGQFLVLHPLDAQQKLFSALQSISHCSLQGLPDLDGKLGSALARAASTLNEALSQSRSAALQLNTDAQGLTDAADQLSDRATSVAAQLEETLSTTQQLDEAIQSNLKATEALVDNTRRLDVEINRGRAAVQNTSQQMLDISNRVKETQSIVEAIDEIAFKTNILALNAAVEAARAGDSGRGFSVLAQEVRALASHASNQANDIRDLLHRVQHSSGAGQKVVTEVNDSLQGLFDDVKQITRGISDIRENSNDQAQGMREAAVALEQISGLNENNASLAEELSGLAGKLKSQTGYMLDSLEVFKLQDGFSHPRHQAAYEIVSTTAERIGKALEAAVSRGEIRAEDLFDRHHEVVPDTDPVRYHTHYDKLCDRILPPIQEPALEQSGFLIYLIATDTHGYVPTHNNRFCKPLTGNPAQDLAGNRTKRIFTDRVGQSSGAHEKEYLLLTYRRDTGEVLSDLSCPVYVHGQHWGGVRSGYSL